MRNKAERFMLVKALSSEKRKWKAEKNNNNRKEAKYEPS